MEESIKLMIMDLHGMKQFGCIIQYLIYSLWTVVICIVVVGIMKQRFLH